MKANKELGQHFLTDQSVIEKITEQSFNKDCSHLLEVGPGQGALTKNLSQKDLPLFLVEKDTRFKEILESFIIKENIIFQDALEINWASFCHQHHLEKVWLISNLPYNIGTLLTLNFIQAEQILHMTLMMQKEVGLRFLPIKSNHMNSLAVLAQTYFDVERLCLVPPGAFNPPPKVDSIVLNFSRKKSPEIPLALWSIFQIFLKNLFQQRRKQIRKVLCLTYSKSDVENYLNQESISFEIRAESLKLEQVQKLFYLFHT